MVDVDETITRVLCAYRCSQQQQQQRWRYVCGDTARLRWSVRRYRRRRRRHPRCTVELQADARREIAAQEFQPVEHALYQLQP